MYGSLDISTSGLLAQRTRMNVISANLANANAILNEAGEYEPYQRRLVVFGEGEASGGRPGGVQVESIQIDPSPPLMRYEPWHPFANADGYVGYPNVNPVVEQMDMMLAARAYDANVSAVEATKSMMSVALHMIA